MNLKQQIDNESIKCIFGSSNEYKREYLRRMDVSFRFLNEINSKIIESWEYEKSKNIIREMFKGHEKYQHGKQCIEDYNYMIFLWKKEWPGEAMEWAFKSTEYDSRLTKKSREITKENYVTEMNKWSEQNKKNCIMKRLTSSRNDYIEYRVFEQNEDIIPTFPHRKGCDFYIYGYSYDQKVTNSTTSQYVKDYGIDWEQHARNNPANVAKYLYKYQDENRFDSSPRLYIIILSKEICLQSIDFKLTNDCYKVDFDYHHKNSSRLEKYLTECLVKII